jgi:hypothetical protein
MYPNKGSIRGGPELSTVLIAKTFQNLSKSHKNTYQAADFRQVPEVPKKKRWNVNKGLINRSLIIWLVDHWLIDRSIKLDCRKMILQTTISKYLNIWNGENSNLVLFHTFEPILVDLSYKYYNISLNWSNTSSYKRCSILLPWQKVISKEKCANLL